MALLILTACIGIGMITIEKLWPNSMLPNTPFWWSRAIAFNVVQASISFMGAITWDLWLPNFTLFDVSASPLWLQIMVGYLVITFIYYWWHRARHEISFLWKWVHQIHHSPARLEVVMSFYKHPSEIVLNGLLSSWILYSLLGVNPIAAAVVVSITGIAEFFYHWNISTPYWLGYFIQRPESHRVHHQRDVHYFNFSDLPIWDMLFGTFKNPKSCPVEVGFELDKELSLMEMLKGKQV